MQKMDSLARAKGAEYVGTAELVPNDAIQNLMIPSGWGGHGSYLFGGLNGVYPAPYTTKPDMSGSFGFCVGNPMRHLNVSLSLNITDVDNIRDMSMNFIASRQLFKGTRLAVGGLQLFSGFRSDSPRPTFYAAVSHAVQSVHSKMPQSSGLSFTIGYGNGRFLNKSGFDIATGKGRFGTAVFGSISYEVLKHVNLNAEWTGMNLGLSLGARPFKNPFSIGIGVANLTRYSSDKPNMVFSAGFPVSLSRLK